jgi:DNA-binding NtrC family response regulator
MTNDERMEKALAETLPTGGFDAGFRTGWKKAIGQLFDTEVTTEKQEVPRLKSVEKDLIEKALTACGGNIVNAAVLLDVPRSTLYDKICKLNIKMELCGGAARKKQVHRKESRYAVAR